MSGGAYGYLAAKLDAAASDIEQTIRENTRCKPSWKPETLERLREGVACLRRAAVYEYRIDRLLCHDDGEECFHKWLPRSLAQLDAETPADLAQLVAEVRRLRQALGFYADPAAWEWKPDPSGGWSGRLAVTDGGARARAALASSAVEV